MVSNSMEKHFTALLQERNRIFPQITKLTVEELWFRPSENKWSIGEILYHIYLLIRVFKKASIVFIPLTYPIAVLRKNKAYKTTSIDIYQQYKDRGKKIKPLCRLFLLKKWLLNTMEKS